MVPSAARKVGAWLGRLDAFLRDGAPGRGHPPLALGEAFAAAGPLRLLVLFQLATFWLAVNLKPIVAPDYDMFFHLAHGRWQAEHGAVPADAWFSFLEPRTYVDYYWLFQRLVYSLWQAGGFPALMGLRLFTSTVVLLVLAAFLFGGLRSAGAALSGLLVLGLVGTQLVDVLSNIRPFVFSFLLLLLILWILERRERWLPFLPLLTVAWINLHGVEHPVLLLVLGAYLGDELLATARRGELTADSRRRFRWLLLCLPAMLLSPHGWRLILFPFKSTALASYYVTEMKKPGSEAFTAVGFGAVEISAYSGTLLLFALAVAACWRNWRHHRLQPAHPLLLAGAAALALQGYRFNSEFALLSLPLLASGSLFPEGLRSGWRRPLATLLVLGLSGLQWLRVVQPWIAESRGSYPLASNDFPYLTSTFLAKVAPPGGRVFNSINEGGFLIWELGERHRFMMDMEVQALFLDDDFFLNRLAAVDPAVFRVFLDRYQPDWLAFSHDVARASALFLRDSAFVPVAVDDSLVLLVDRRRHPELAAQWGLEALDPWRVELDPEYRLGPEAVPEAHRLYQLDPRCLRLGTLLAKEALGRGDLAAAAGYVDRLIEQSPDNADTWNLASLLQVHRGDLEGAAEALGKALKRSAPEQENRLRGPLAHLLHELGRDREALDQLRGRWKFYEPMAIQDLELQVILLEKYGPPAEAAAARAVLELRRGQPLP